MADVLEETRRLLRESLRREGDLEAEADRLSLELTEVRVMRQTKARSEAIREVVEALERAYHPQNPISAHPADFVESEFSEALTSEEDRDG